MRGRTDSSESGQALIMVTLGLLAMSGLIGLAVDFGWSYFVRREAQSAADSAALAAARAAMDVVIANGASALSCTSLSCGGETSCSAGLTGTWQSACQYAQQNGFSAGGDAGRQQVTVAAGVNTPSAPAPTVPNVYVRYWVTVRVTNSIPQLYSAVLGNANATIAARATAAITDFLVNGSMIALNREGDPAPTWQQPNSFNTNPDLLIGPGSFVLVPPNGGIALASNDAGAGTNLGSLSPVSPVTATRGNLSPASSWASAHASTGLADSTQFVDPYRGMGQPPLPTSPLSEYPVEGGNLAAAPACSTGACPPGVYYATSGGVATGAPLTVNSNLNFANSGSWGDYVFYGGLNITGATVNLGMGRYVLAGVVDPTTTPALNIGAGAHLFGGNGNDAGRLLVVTNSTYPGLSAIAPLPAQMPALSYGPINLDAASGTIRLFGINPAQAVPADQNSMGYTLSDFGPTLIWQDQGYSNITQPSNTSAQIVFGSNLQLEGVIYQPRGAWVKFRPNTQFSGVGVGVGPAGVRVIAGALDVGANASLNFCGSGCSQGAPLWNHTVALIE